MQHNGQQITVGTVAGTHGQEKIIKDSEMDSKTKTPFQLFFSPSNDIRGGVCHNLS